MALWLFILLLAAWVALAIPASLTRLMSDPLRRPWEGQRQADARAEMRRLGHRVDRWLLGYHDRGNEPNLIRMTDSTDFEFRFPAVGRRPILAAWSVTPANFDEESGAVAILLHGFSDSSASMRFTAERFAELGIASLLVDLPGHGFSPRSPCTFGYREVPALLTLIENLPWEGDHRVYLAGGSLGGAFSLMTAFRASPETRVRIAGVIAACPYWSLRQAMFRYARQAFGITSRKLTAKILKTGEELHGFDTRRESPKGCARQWRDASSKNPRGQLPPLLLLRGDLDELYDIDVPRAIAQNWPGPVEHVELPGLKHFALCSREPTLDAMADWLRGQGAA